MLQTFLSQNWSETFSPENKEEALTGLENGQILYFPRLAFEVTPNEAFFLNPKYADPQAKNISYQPNLNKLWGVQRLTDDERIKLKCMLDRFSQHASGLIRGLLPAYESQALIGRTSFRPVEISNRKTSYRKDDKRLHVDAFPSAPNQGKRILRVFCNINPHNEARIWRIGEPFEKVAEQFLTGIRKPIPGTGALLRFLKVTKSYRTLYDHYMLHLHDRMKADNAYQKTAAQKEVAFPAGSSWIVQTDHVSHAAMSGQYVLEQTFYLPLTAMQDESKSPLRILEKRLGLRLV